MTTCRICVGMVGVLIGMYNMSTVGLHHFFIEYASHLCSARESSQSSRCLSTVHGHNVSPFIVSVSLSVRPPALTPVQQSARLLAMAIFFVCFNINIIIVIILLGCKYVSAVLCGCLLWTAVEGFESSWGAGCQRITSLVESVRFLGLVFFVGHVVKC
jgi:hypothetical protein